MPCPEPDWEEKHDYYVQKFDTKEFQDYLKYSDSAPTYESAEEYADIQVEEDHDTWVQLRCGFFNPFHFGLNGLYVSRGSGQVGGTLIGRRKPVF